MRTFLAFSLVATGILLAGCASDNKTAVTLDAVGPVPTQAPTSEAIPATNGTLVVYSAFRRSAYFDTRDPYRPEYSDYRIFADDGKFLRGVHNDSGTPFQDPASVLLAPGKYRIYVRANGFGYITVPVLIEAQKNTVLHLEGGNEDASGLNPANAVRLPDGKIVGWKAPAS
jgi:hypothetical protein